MSSTLSLKVQGLYGRSFSGGRRGRENLSFIVLALLLLVVFPLGLDVFRLNLVG